MHMIEKQTVNEMIDALDDLFSMDLRENGEFFFNDAHKLFAVVSIAHHEKWGEKVVISEYDVPLETCSVSELKGLYHDKCTLARIYVCDDDSEARAQMGKLFAQCLPQLDMSV